MGKDYNLFISDYFFRGKHRDYAEALSNLVIDKKSNSKIFDSSIDLFMAAVLIGCRFNARSKPMKGETRKIMTSQFQLRYFDLMFIYSLVMLTNDFIEKDEDRIDNAFRNMNEAENWDLFQEYMLGGLEILYNTFFPEKDSFEKSNYDDYFDRLQTLLTDFKDTDKREEVMINPFE